MSHPPEDDRLPTVDELLETSNWSAQLEAARARRAQALRDRAERPPLREIKPWESPEYLASEAPPRRAAPVVRAGPALSGTPRLAPTRARRPHPMLAAAAGLFVLGGVLSPGIAERMGLRLAGAGTPSVAAVDAAVPVERGAGGTQTPSSLAQASGTPVTAISPEARRAVASPRTAPTADGPQVQVIWAALPSPPAAARAAPAVAGAGVEPPPARAAAPPLVASAAPASPPFVETAASRPDAVSPAVLAMMSADADPATAPVAATAPPRLSPPERPALPAGEALPQVTPPDAPRIVVFLPDGAATNGSEQALAMLEAAGFKAEEPGSVGFRVSATHVRHYHPSDRARAEDVAVAVGGGLRDFTDFRPLPPPGTIELWLAGEPRAAPAPVARVRRVEPRPAAAPAPRFLTAILPDGSRQRMRIIDETPAAVTRAARQPAAPVAAHDTARRPPAGGNDRASPAAGARTTPTGAPSREPAASPRGGGGAVSAPAPGGGRSSAEADRASRGEARGNGNGRDRDGGNRGGNGRGAEGNGGGGGRGNGNGGGKGNGNGGNGNGDGKGRG